jgi:hypothetical protein
MVVAVMCSSALPQHVKKRLKMPPASIEGESAATFKGIEAAWLQGDAQGLSNYMRDSKVLLNVAGLGEQGGYFSKSQAFYLFKGMFKATKHKQFRFIKYHDVSQSNRRVYGVAHRSFQDVSSGRLYRDKIYITLKLEGERWVISEIKSTR